MRRSGSPQCIEHHHVTATEAIWRPDLVSRTVENQGRTSHADNDRRWRPIYVRQLGLPFLDQVVDKVTLHGHGGLFSHLVAPRGSVG